MKIEKTKSLRIIKELLSYFLENELSQFQLHYTDTGSELTIHIQATTDALPHTFQSFLADLQVPRELEIDEYFSSLLGSHHTQHDWSFLGKSIDSAQGYYEDGSVHLIITRQHLQ